MATYPNRRYLTLNRARYTSGAPAGYEPLFSTLSTRMNRFLGENWSKQVGDSPSGYGLGGGAFVPAITAGGLSSYQGEAIVVSQTGTMLSAMTLTGSVTGSFTTDGSLSVTIQISGDGTFTFSQTGAINMTTSLSGSGTWTITPSGALNLIVPFAGSGTATFTAAANLKGLSSLAGDITPFTELSPENLAAAVWNAVLSEYQDVGSTGKALNDAGAAGNPWSADASTNNDPGTMGEKLNDAAASGSGSSGLTLGQFLALK